VSGFAFSPSNVWAVGTSFGSNEDSHPLIEHWDGTAWTIVPAPEYGSEGTYLDGISGSSPTDLWATGLALIEHWDGSDWRIVSVSKVGKDFAELRSVVALSPDDVWAAGQYVPWAGGGTIVSHWDGSSWTEASRTSQA
jgi:hypothetical protein